MIDTVTYDGLVYVDKYSGAVNLLVWRVLPVGDGCEARDPKVQNVLNVQLALYLTSQQMYVDWAFKDVKSTETNGLTEMKGSLAAVASSAMWDLITFVWKIAAIYARQLHFFDW